MTDGGDEREGILKGESLFELGPGGCPALDVLPLLKPGIQNFMLQSLFTLNVISKNFGFFDTLPLVRIWK